MDTIWRILILSSQEYKTWRELYEMGEMWLSVCGISGVNFEYKTTSALRLFIIVFPFFSFLIISVHCV